MTENDGRRDGPVPILMYHAVTDTPARATRGLSVTPAAFAAQMALLEERGFTPLGTFELANAWREGRALPHRPVLITFDDGYEGVHRHALPVLKGLGFTSTLFVSTGWLRGDHEVPGAAPDTMLDWDQVRELRDAGTEIGGHSHSHPQLDQLGDERLWFELLRCKEILRDELGAPPASFAYPYGYSTRRVRQAVRMAGYGAALAVGNALADPRRQSPFALARVTVRRGTGIEEFERLVEGRAVARNFAADRVLTQGYSLVRRARRGVRKVRESGV